MARKTRIQAPGVLRHVMSRGNGKMSIFLDDSDYRQFVFLLGDLCEKFYVDCWCYCAMPNHYHAAIRPTRPNLSQFMRELNGDYAQWWNRKHERVGHVYQGRFKDQLVQRETYARTLCRYIARNPVRAGLVDDPAKWAWSSHAAIIGLVPAAPFLTYDDALAQFGDADPDVLRGRYAAYVLGEPGEAALEDRIRSKERILGDAAFKRSFEPAKDTKPKSEGKEHGRLVAPGEIDAEVWAAT